MPYNLPNKIKQDKIQIKKWNKILNIAMWIMFLVLFILEAIFMVLYWKDVLIYRYTNYEYFISFLVIPSITILSTIILSTIIQKFVAKRYHIMIESWVIIITFVIIVTETIAFHYGISVIFILYALPIIASLVYDNLKMLIVSFVSSLIAYMVVLAYIYENIPADDFSHSLTDVLCCLAILGALFALCCFVLSRARELINTAVKETELCSQLSHEVTLDPLTRIYNHATFYQYLDNFIENYKKDDKRKFSLILIDIDNFKIINDTYGHIVGDQVLLCLVNCIKAKLNDHDYAFRYGGEEFAVLTSNPKHAITLAENIRNEFEQSIYPDIPHKITISLGLCTYEHNYTSKVEFFATTDKALYHAKHSGKNRVCVAE